MARKLLAILLAVMMIIPTALVSAIAVGTPTVSLSNASVEAGGTSELTLSLANNPGIAGICVKLQYDRNSFTIDTAAPGVVFGEVTKSRTTGGIQVASDPTPLANVTTNGTYATLSFTAADGVSAGQYPVTVVVEYAYNANDEDVEFEAVSGVITVSAPAQITFAAENVQVNASNIESYRQNDGSFIVPVAINASGIPSDRGMAAFTLTVGGSADIVSITAGSAISDPDQFQVGPDNKIVWVDTNEITAATAQIAVVNVAVAHSVSAGASFTVELTTSSDEDDFLLIDVTSFDALSTNGSVSFAVSGHAYTDTVVAPTCTEAGYTLHTCSICGDTYSSDPVSATGHSYVAAVTAPTCTEAGYTTYTCSVCGDTYTADQVPAAGHSFGDWTVTTPASCTAAGVESRTCPACNTTETRAIEMLAHHYVGGVCTMCGAADPDYDPNVLTFSISDVTVNPGDTITVDVMVENNPGFAGAVVWFDFDPSVFLTGDASAPEDWIYTYSTRQGGIGLTLLANNVKIAGRIGLTFGQAANATRNGKLVSVDFTISENAVPGDYEMSFTVEQIQNQDFQNVPNNVENGIFTVVDSVVWGDATGDGTVDISDVIRIAQYLVDEEGIVTVADGADANGDSDINISDVILLAQYLVDEEGTVVLGPRA